MLEGYLKESLVVSPRHVLHIAVEQLFRRDQLGLAVSVPACLARFAAANDLAQFGGSSFVELFGNLQGWWRELGI